MDAKEYLEYLSLLKDRVFNKELAVLEWETAMGYQSPRFDGDGIRGTATLNKMDMMTNRHLELCNELEALNEEYEYYKKDVMQKLDDFGKTYQLEATILMAKYVNQKSYDEITRITHYSQRWVKKLKKRALEKFDEYLQN